MLYVCGEKYITYKVYSSVNNRWRIENKMTLQNEVCLSRQKDYCKITYNLKSANVYFEFSTFLREECEYIDKGDVCCQNSSNRHINASAYLYHLAFDRMTRSVHSQELVYELKG